MSPEEIWSGLSARNRFESFFDRMITDEEKWITYNNVVCKQSYYQPHQMPLALANPNHMQKRILCIWWDKQGPVHYELLPHAKTITVDVYRAQTSRLNQKIIETRPVIANGKKVILQHENARPYVAIATRKKIVEFSREAPSHPLHSWYCTIWLPLISIFATFFKWKNIKFRGWCWLSTAAIFPLRKWVLHKGDWIAVWEMVKTHRKWIKLKVLYKKRHYFLAKLLF